LELPPKLAELALVDCDFEPKVTSLDLTTGESLRSVTVKPALGDLSLRLPDTVENLTMLRFCLTTILHDRVNLDHVRSLRLLICVHSPVDKGKLQVFPSVQNLALETTATAEWLEHFFPCFPSLTALELTRPEANLPGPEFRRLLGRLRSLRLRLQDRVDSRAFVDSLVLASPLLRQLSIEVLEPHTGDAYLQFSDFEQSLDVQLGGGSSTASHCMPADFIDRAIERRLFPD